MERHLIFANLFAIAIFQSAKAQNIDSLKKTDLQKTEIRTKPETDLSPLRFLIYTRIIREANGNVRLDQSFVPNIKINKWLRIELGIRQGEQRTENLSSYYAYKAGLQTKAFFGNRVRFIARVSDDVVQYPKPFDSKTNYLFIAEGEQKISRSFSILFAYGYVGIFQQNQKVAFNPLIKGTMSSFPTYKTGLRYKLKDKGYVEALLGSYDLFNPYLLSQPFAQLTFDHEINRKWTFYSYYRYQYNQSLDAPLNNFLSFGVRYNLQRYFGH